MSLWAVVACDQFTSQPEYWEKVEKNVDNAPSTYWMILPEAYLGTQKETEHQNAIQANMQAYLDKNLFSLVEGFVYIERSFADKKRRGLVAALDLEKYDFHKGAKSLIRATEGTIIERLPPRIKIRKNAILELPHILVLIDDPEKSVIEPLAEGKSRFSKLYDFDLMLNGGHLEGFQVSDDQIEKQIIQAFENLIQPSKFHDRYQLSQKESPFLFAVGDGNHSLAAAKSVWDEIKSSVNKDHPAHFALVEIVNIHDDGIIFEPIHRLLKGASQSLLPALTKFFANRIRFDLATDFISLKKNVVSHVEGQQKFGVFSQKGYWVGEILNPKHTLTVGSIQEFLDDFRVQNASVNIDYVHGDEVLQQLGIQDENAGIFLPAMQKSQLFTTVIREGELPRKTFSMGEANEKRYYLECRKIQL